MADLSSQALGQAARVVGEFCTWLTVVVALAVLMGWGIGNQLLTAVVPGLVAMNPLTAICFILSGAALLLWRKEGTAGARLWLPVALASVVGLCGLARLAGYILGWDLHLDRLIFSSQLNQVSGLPNRMAPNTAFNFCLIGLAIAVMAFQRIKLAQSLALGAALTAFIALIGYAYSVTSLVRVAAFIPMALHTAVLFLLMAGAILCATPKAGPMAAITSGSPGGRVIRGMLPTLILAPPLFGWLRLQGELAGLYGPSFGVALLVGAMVVMGLVLSWVTARAVDLGEAERRRAEEITLRLAHFDNLTGLPNRTLFEDRLRRALARAKRAEGMVALLFLDLDGFKKVNDTLGHEAGDQALMEAAKRIQSALRTEDTAARLGGDEFTVVLEHVKCSEDVEAVGRRLVSLLNRPYLLTGREAQLSASIGVSVYPNDGLLPADLLQRADVAMYRAKRAGKNQIAFHNPILAWARTTELRGPRWRPRSAAGGRSPADNIFKIIEEIREQRRPSTLVAGTQALAHVGVKVLVKERELPEVKRAPYAPRYSRSIFQADAPLTSLNLPPGRLCSVHL